jgi:hypothetical protein
MGGNEALGDQPIHSGFKHMHVGCPQRPPMRKQESARFPSKPVNECMGGNEALGDQPIHNVFKNMHVGCPQRPPTWNEEQMTYKSVLQSWPISLTSLAKGSFLIRSAVLFWCFLISLSATVPGRYLCFFFCPAVEGADERAFFVGRLCFGTGPPVNLRALLLIPLRAA